MKKESKKSSSPADPAGIVGQGITRRDFLKGTAGFVLLCGAGFSLRGLAETSPSAEAAVGPRLRDGLRIVQTENGAEVTYGGGTCFAVNEKGLELLKMADGRQTLQDMIRDAGLEKDPEPAVDFFLTLGRAGYLADRLEVSKVAVIM